MKKINKNSGGKTMGEHVWDNKLYKKGSRGMRVKIIQEWLCINGYNVFIDRDFGPATEYAVEQFQSREGLTVDGVVGKNTYERLVLPIKNALEPISTDERTLGELIVEYARQHLNQHPVEIGGQNKGPWVRLYMNGNEGTEWPWCAGFVSFILKQTCRQMNISLPINTSVSCDFLAASAKEKGLFMRESDVTDIAQITPGSFFLNRRTSTDWVHTGIVTRAEENVYHTIEGNTNDEGSREGYEVCERVRGYKKKDFIII